MPEASERRPAGPCRCPWGARTKQRKDAGDRRERRRIDAEGIVTTEDAALRRVLVRQGTTNGRLVGAGPRTPPDRSVYAIRGATKGGTAAVP